MTSPSPVASDINLYRGSPEQVLYWVKRILNIGRIPMIQGSPGIGKSAMIRALAKEMNLKIMDDRVSSNGPEHYTGLPDVSGNKSVYKPFDVFPLEGDPLPKDADGKEMGGWLLYLSEFNSGLPSTLVAVYKLLQEREIGQKPLHSKVYIVADGNRDEDRAITSTLGSALQRRLVWLEMYLDGTDAKQFDHFMRTVALPQRWNSKTVAYLNYKKSALNAFDPEHQEKTFPCPGTWEIVSQLSDDADPVLEDAPLYAGAVGASHGVDYVNFCQVFGGLVTLEEILDNPAIAPIAQDSLGNPDLQKQWATVSMLIEASDKSNLASIADYVDRMNLEFRIVYWRSIQISHPDWRSEPTFIRAFTNLGRYLFGA